MGKIMAKTTTKTIGYLRVSTTDQDLGKNKSDILHLANAKKLRIVEWVKEKASGKVSWKKRKVAQIIDGFDTCDSSSLTEIGGERE